MCVLVAHSHKYNTMCETMIFAVDGERSYLGITVAIGVQADLSDEGVVGHHHCARPEESLEVVRELAAASITRVHRDKDCACGVQGNLAVLKHKAFHIGHDRQLDREDLLRHH